jgi:hypothetical protein
MGLEQWQENGWIQAVPVSAEEVQRLLDVADRSLADAGVHGVSNDARVGFAHAATIAAAAGALAATGYRAGRDRHHERLLDSLRYTIEIDGQTLKQLHQVRRTRNAMTYEKVGETTSAEADAIVARARQTREAVHAWLLKEHPVLPINPLS